MSPLMDVIYDVHGCSLRVEKKDLQPIIMLDRKLEVLKEHSRPMRRNQGKRREVSRCTIGCITRKYALEEPQPE